MPGEQTLGLRGGQGVDRCSLRPLAPGTLQSALTPPSRTSGWCIPARPLTGSAPQPKGISALVPIPWDLLAAGLQNHPQRLWLLQAKYKYVILSLGLQASSCGASLVGWGALGP